MFWNLSFVAPQMGHFSGGATSEKSVPLHIGHRSGLRFGTITQSASGEL